MKNIYIIGAGGVGSWLVPSLVRLTSAAQITVIDMDTLEEKNLDRQLFKPADIGKSKAEALAELYNTHARAEWFSEGALEFDEQDWLLVCVDNHRARAAALAECDRWGCKSIFGANETHSAEAYYYDREWRDGPLDPRIYFPDILTDLSGDPRARGIGCTGEAQQENRQLVTSNMLAAGLMGHLFALWHLHAPTVKLKTIPSLPYRLVANRTRLETHLIKDKLKGQENGRTTNTTVDGGTGGPVVAAGESSNTSNGTTDGGNAGVTPSSEPAGAVAT